MKCMTINEKGKLLDNNNDNNKINEIFINFPSASVPVLRKIYLEGTASIFEEKAFSPPIRF